ncbi:hypothetical protein AB0I34_22020 [Kribbella sp. NPDC050281]|uniref:hypothetical protein n=1 Tax=Kribbella sp. NPDC050281 TaxID=3155515 RepID=UPI0033CC6416
MSKFLGFLLGVAVALAGPAVFGVLAAPGGIELNAKEMALAYGIGALIFWTVVSYFSGAGALGAFIAFGTLIYCWLWIPNRTTNFLNDVPGVTNGMIVGSRQYTLNGVVPILAVISLVYGIQLIVQSTQRRRRERAEAERWQQEQEAVQAQQEADAAALYPVAGSTYPGQYAETYESRSRFDDLFDEDPEPVRPRNQADEQTAQFPAAGTAENTAQFRGMNNDAEGNEFGDHTELVPTDRDETTQVPSGEPQQEKQPEAAQPVAEQQLGTEDEQVTQVPMSASAPAAGAAEQETEQVPVREAEEPTQQVPVSEQQETQQVQAEPEVPVEEPKPTDPQAPSEQTAGTQEPAAPQEPSEQPAGTQEPAGPQAPSEQPAGTQEAAGPQTSSEQTAGTQEPAGAQDAGGSTAASGGAAAASGGQSAAPVDEAEQETQQVPVQTAQQAEPEARPEEPKPAGPEAPSGPAAGAAAAGAAGASGGQPGTAEPVVKSGGQASAPQAGGEEPKPAGPPAPSGQAAAPQAPGGMPEGKGERVGTPPVPEVREQGVAPVPGVREQVGSQYRERMDDPEDTGEIFISAFENPPVVDGPGQIRAAGA